MKFLYDFIQKFGPLFKKGGKLEKLYPIYEMGEGFMFVLPYRTKTGAHIRDAIDMKRFMITVYAALIPAFIFGIFNAGYQHFLSVGIIASVWDMILKGAIIVIPIYLIVLVTGGVWEVLFAVIRKHEINEGFLITSFLIPLIVPPTKMESTILQLAVFVRSKINSPNRIINVEVSPILPGIIPRNIFHNV